MHYGPESMLIYIICMVYINIYIYIYTYVYVHIYIYIHAYTIVFQLLHMCTCMHIYILRLRVHVYVDGEHLPMRTNRTMNLNDVFSTQRVVDHVSGMRSVAHDRVSTRP